MLIGLDVGGETISTTLSGLFFYLSRNRDVYDKLAEEVRIVFPDDADVCNGPRLTSCKYLRACIDETLRMSPPVGGALWREQNPDSKYRNEVLVVDGHVIPPGTQVGVSIYALHHDEKYFSDASTFRPERWLVEDEKELSRMNSAFCPFSLGSRGCPGKSMAYMEVSLVVAKTLLRFDFAAAPGKVGETGAGIAGKTDGRGLAHEFQLYDALASAGDGPSLMFRKRDDGRNDTSHEVTRSEARDG